MTGMPARRPSSARKPSADGRRDAARRSAKPAAAPAKHAAGPSRPAVDDGVLRALIDDAPVALAMFDRKLHFIAHSRRWVADYQLGDAPLVGRSLYDVFPNVPDRWKQIHKRALAGEIIRSDEELLTRPGGAHQWLRWEVRPWRGPHNRIGGILVFREDITSRKDAERDLRDSQRRLRAILETAVDAIITIDQHGDIQSVNPATLRLFGYAEAELLGRNIKLLMPSPYRDEHDEYLRRYAATGERRIIGVGREVQARRKDGTIFSVDLAVSEVEPGRLFTGIIRDISDRKLAEARVRESDRLASIGTLAAGLGHDMNNVLLPVRAHMNALRSAIQKGDLPASTRTHVEEVRRSVAYLQQLADGLHFLAMDTDAEADDRGGGSTTDLHHWWSQAGALLSSAVPRHVQVQSTIPAHLPHVQAAPHGLTQAVLNLVVNAGEAIPRDADDSTRHGLVRIWADLVTSSDAGPGQFIRLAVTDNGSGMTDEVRRRAFEMFYTTKPRGLGTGLGLALVRKVAERAKGRVTIDSQLGKGTTVTLWLPAVVRHAPAGRPVITASLTLHDGRAASLITHLLESMRVTIAAGSAATKADILILDAARASPADARAWRRSSRHGRLVLFGAPPDPRLWKRLSPVMITSREDFPAIRSTLAAVVGEFRRG